jgi:hypothetical protein
MTRLSQYVLRHYSVVLLSLVILFTCFHRSIAAQLDDLQSGFLNPPDDSRIMMRWWWFGPAVDKAQLEREMRLMKEGGIGGFEVQPVYPLVLDDATKGIKTSPFLSDEFPRRVAFHRRQSERIGSSF